MKTHVNRLLHLCFGILLLLLYGNLNAQEVLKDTKNVSSEMAKDFSDQIKGFLTSDMLTDKEEGKILIMFETAKLKGFSNDFFNALTNEQLNGENLWIAMSRRWNEEINTYEEPGFWDEFLSYFTGDNLPEKPENNNNFGVVFQQSFTDKNLSTENSQMVCDMYLAVLIKNYGSIANVSYLSQKAISDQVTSHPLDTFTKEAISTFKIILKPFNGPASKIHFCDPGRRVLGLRTYKSGI